MVRRRGQARVRVQGTLYCMEGQNRDIPWKAVRGSQGECRSVHTKGDIAYPKHLRLEAMLLLESYSFLRSYKLHINGMTSPAGPEARTLHQACDWFL